MPKFCNGSFLSPIKINQNKNALRNPPVVPKNHITTRW